MIPAPPKFAYEIGPKERMQNRGADNDILASKKVSITLADGTQHVSTVFFRTSPDNLRKLLEDPGSNVRSNRATIQEFKQMIRDSGKSAEVADQLVAKVHAATLRNNRKENNVRKTGADNNEKKGTKPLLERNKSLRELVKKGEIGMRKLEETGKIYLGDMAIQAATFESLFYKRVDGNQLPAVDSNLRIYDRTKALKNARRKPLPLPPKNAGTGKSLKAGQGKPLPPTPPAKAKPPAPTASTATKPSSPPKPVQLELPELPDEL